MPSAVVATAFGGPDVLTLTDIDVADPGPGQVHVSVRAAGVNPIDWKSYSGSMGADPASLPLRMGYEAAGVVTAVGEGATGPAGPIGVGDEVIVYATSGGYATDLVVDADLVLPKPQRLDWAAASGLMLVGVTAVHALEVTSVSTDDTVLLHGGAGGVGLSAIQLAIARGATVIATANERNHDELRALGATPVTYGEGWPTAYALWHQGGVDVAIDCVGTQEAVSVSVELVSERARRVSIAAFGTPGSEQMQLIGGGPGADPGTELRNAARMDLVRWATDGTLTVKVAATYPLAAAAEAHRLGAQGHTSGKIVLLT